MGKSGQAEFDVQGVELEIDVGRTVSIILAIPLQAYTVESFNFGLPIEKCLYFCGFAKL